MKLTRTWRALLLTSLAAATSLASIVVAPRASAITPWLAGDVFVGAGNGSYKIYDSSGNLKETISDGLGGVTTGCAFNPSLTKLYTTNWSLNKVEVYDNASHNLVQTINTTSFHNESVVFTRNGDFYVSHPGGGIDHYSAAGTLLAVLASGVRADWMDLASDQTQVRE